MENEIEVGKLSEGAYKNDDVCKNGAAWPASPIL